MNKIRFVANKDTNYVFHMLSVAKCGYDNVYGEKFRNRYPEEDFKALNDYKDLLTVCGGEHCGKLYDLMVCKPACAELSAKDYYNTLKEKAEEQDISEKFKPYTEIIRSISKVMVKYYDDYIENIWSGEKEKINSFITALWDFFEKNDFTEKAERLIGNKLHCDFFTATLVTSVENGAEAIDISREQDVFGIERDFLDEVYFIGHEFIVYLLFDALKGENAFKSFETWPLTEGLAEFYLIKIMGGTRFNSHQKYVEFYEKQDKVSQLSAAGLYKMALKTI